MKAPFRLPTHRVNLDALRFLAGSRRAVRVEGHYQRTELMVIPENGERYVGCTGATLRRWVGEGLIVSVRLKGRPPCNNTYRATPALRRLVEAAGLSRAEFAAPVVFDGWSRVAQW